MEMRFCITALRHADRCVGDQAAKEGDDARSLVCDKDQEEKKKVSSLLCLSCSPTWTLWSLKGFFTSSRPKEMLQTQPPRLRV